MMSLTFGLVTQVSDSGPHSSLVSYKIENALLFFHIKLLMQINFNCIRKLLQIFEYIQSDFIIPLY